MFDISISDRWYVMRYRNLEIGRLIKHVEENNKPIDFSLVVDGVQFLPKLSLHDLKDIQKRYGSTFTLEFVTIEDNRVCVYSKR